MENLNKKIIFSANSSWYLSNFRSSTLKKFIDEGYEVTCLAPKDGSTNALQNLGCKFIDLKMDNKGKNFIKDLKLIYSFYHAYRLIDPFAVFNFTIKNNIYGAYAASLTRTRVFSHITGLGTAIIHRGLTALTVKLMYKTSQLFAKAVFCQNFDDSQFFITNGLIPKKKIKILPGSGVDLQHYSQATKIPIKNKAGSDLLIFLYAGRVLKDKGLIELVEAVRLINLDKVVCKLKIHGFTNNKNLSSISVNEIKSWEKIPGIEWCGATNNMKKILGKVDCVVLPSYREGMPRSLLEAAAMSLPLIASNVPGCREIVLNNINGILCNPKDHIDLQRAMQQMINFTPSQRSIMGEAGRKLVEQQFDERIVINAALSAVR
ncbi:glycosyltransferase family 4 protein [Gammaproteobacteria bacterium]|nr:glycosyltransferase family 4 protein [Gammaproteobacteria bacterium]